MVGAHDAQDVVSDAVVRVMSSDRWSRVENKRAYLYRAVVNEAMMMMRARTRRRARELLVASMSNGRDGRRYPGRTCTRRWTG